MTEKRWFCFALGFVLVLGAATGASAGDGVVALQTADPSCPDDTGNIYVDCGNGTVTDNRTGLVWLKDANCLTGIGSRVGWKTAMMFVLSLSDAPSGSAAATQDCGLSDGSSPGEWRLPSVKEWEAMIADAVALGCYSGASGGPTITNDAGTDCWQEGPESSFTGVIAAEYWSSTMSTFLSESAYRGNLFTGEITVGVMSGEASDSLVWPVRGGQ
jgi:hypothetical protein